MLTFTQAAVLGLLQGFTELFPISSLGHSVLVPGLLGWHIDQSSQYFLPFLTLTHLATALALLIFFWRDWFRIVRGVFQSFGQRKRHPDPYARLGWLLIIGTIPAGLLGIVFEKKLTLLFSNPKAVAVFLLLNGILLFGVEILRRRKKIDMHISQFSWLQALGVGILQSLALLPGFSRTGATLGGGLLVGLSHEDAARFSFLLATPIILAAAILEVPHLLLHTSGIILPALLGALCAAVTAYGSVRFLLRYFKTNTLFPFALYCVLMGAFCFFVL